jgi:hypothetical protein
MHLVLEAVVVGISLIIFGQIGGFMASNLVGDRSVNEMCKEWNKNHVMELSLFLTGFIAHFTFEVSGINEWYCKFGNACKVL